MEKTKLAIEAISLYQTQYSHVDKIWNYFSIVSLGVVGFILQGSELIGDKSPIILAVYLVFCIGNHKALVSGQKQLEQLSEIAISLSEKAGLDTSTLKPLPSEWIKKFHFTLIIAFSIGLFFLSLEDFKILFFKVISILKFYP